MNKPLVTFVACAHNEPIHNRVFVDSILNQIDKNWYTEVWHNGENSFMWKDIIERVKIEDSHKSTNLVFKYSNSDRGSWGTFNREQAIQECTTDYIIQTSIQDYWLLQATASINSILQEQKPDLLIWNSINHIVGPCKELDAKIEWGEIDWGNFAMRTDIAKQIKIKHGQYCADFFFVAEAVERGLVKKVLKLPLILTIHN